MLLFVCLYEVDGLALEFDKNCIVYLLMLCTFQQVTVEVLRC